jgi:hypothetical protein
LEEHFIITFLKFSRQEFAEKLVSAFYQKNLFDITKRDSKSALFPVSTVAATPTFSRHFSRHFFPPFFPANFSRQFFPAIFSRQNSKIRKKLDEEMLRQWNRKFLYFD